MFRGLERGGGGRGRGLDGIPMEGIFVEMDRGGGGGGGALPHGKRQLMCVLSILKFACAFV